MVDLVTHQLVDLYAWSAEMCNAGWRMNANRVLHRVGALAVLATARLLRLSRWLRPPPSLLFNLSLSLWLPLPCHLRPRRSPSPVKHADLTPQPLSVPTVSASSTAHTPQPRYIRKRSVPRRSRHSRHSPDHGKCITGAPDPESEFLHLRLQTGLAKPQAASVFPLRVREQRISGSVGSLSISVLPGEIAAPAADDPRERAGFWIAWACRPAANFQPYQVSLKNHDTISVLSAQKIGIVFLALPGTLHSSTSYPRPYCSAYSCPYVACEYPDRACECLVCAYPDPSLCSLGVLRERPKRQFAALAVAHRARRKDCASKVEDNRCVCGLENESEAALLSLPKCRTDVNSAHDHPSFATYPPPTRAAAAAHARLLSWFLDEAATLFSVHRMVLAGKAAGKDVGIMLIDAFPSCGLDISIATDGMLYQTEVYAASHSPAALAALAAHPQHAPAHAHPASQLSSSSGHSHGKHGKKGEKGGKARGWGDRPVLLLLGIQLGLDGVNPVYRETINFSAKIFKRRVEEDQFGPLLVSTSQALSVKAISCKTIKTVVSSLFRTSREVALSSQPLVASSNLSVSTSYIHDSAIAAPARWHQLLFVGLHSTSRGGTCMTLLVVRA
ncbi:hypothetical protein B0H11DRAFT_2227312 [Mycena galericulata]|nr:hypothetical protein B0H11DRAFT_2227312 [Mycena galericulata]